jgi:hypothetical protein
MRETNKATPYDNHLTGQYADRVNAELREP